MFKTHINHTTDIGSFGVDGGGWWKDGHDSLTVTTRVFLDHKQG